MSIVSLRGYTPPGRTAPDNALWLQARIEESATRAGVYTVIEPAFALDPAVTDPAAPPTYSFTTDGATIGPGGWYRVVWIDANTVEQATDPVQYVQLPDWAPSVADVAALLRSRTRVATRQHGTFDYETSPTGPQVEDLIQIACVVVQTTFRDPFDVLYEPMARRLASLYAAMQVELSYYPEQTTGDDTVYGRLKELYEAGMLALLDAMGDAGAGPDAPYASATVGSAIFDMYVDLNGLADDPYVS